MNTTHLKCLCAVLLALASSSVLATQPTSYYIYDESGHVIGEYDANGNPVQEHVYLGDRPVAVVQGGSSSGGTVDYVTTDQLNTPRVITDSSQTVMWSWNSDPFGNGNPTGSLPNSQPYNLRFPGQYYDQETGHNYNLFRDYDSAMGRYIESDPAGLQGGLNTYRYVSNNPVARSDKFGLNEKWDQAWNVGPYDAYQASRDAQAAISAAVASGLPGLHNGPADALRHCLWSCLMTRDIGADQAKDVGDLHEDEEPDEPTKERQMDLANNAAGRSAANETTCHGKKPCLQACLDKLKSGDLFGLGGQPLKYP